MNRLLVKLTITAAAGGLLFELDPENGTVG